PVERDAANEAIGFPDEWPPLGPETAAARLAAAAKLGLPILVRVVSRRRDGPESLREIIEAVRPFAAAVALTTLEAATGWRSGECRRIGGPARLLAREWVRALRQTFGPNLPLVAAGGVHEPEHALALRAAGADLVEIDSGLVFNGPGLVKRANDALLYELTS